MQVVSAKEVWIVIWLSGYAMIGALRVSGTVTIFLHFYINGHL
jgi:hypothetical protein